MVDPRKLGGRLGNQMFQLAFLLGLQQKGAIPDIYVQDMEYWEHCKDLIKAWFGEGIGYDDRVAIHVRRGDYLGKGDFYVNLGEGDYYERAIAEFPDRRFLVFCHDGQDAAQDKADMEWCRERFTGDQFDFYSHTDDEIEDFNALASCDGIIMANSTFSWWGAFLGYQDKKVVAPHSWFIGQPHPTYPQTWKII